MIKVEVENDNKQLDNPISLPPKNHSVKRIIITSLIGLLVFATILGIGIGYVYSHQVHMSKVISVNNITPTSTVSTSIALPKNLQPLPTGVTLIKEATNTSSLNILTALFDGQKEVRIINEKGVELFKLDFNSDIEFFQWNPNHRYLFIQTFDQSSYLFDSTKGELSFLRQDSDQTITTYFWRDNANLIKINYQDPPDYKQGDFPQYISPTIYNYSIESNTETLIGKFPNEPYFAGDYLGAPLPERPGAESKILGFVLNNNLIVADLSKNQLKNDYFTYNIKTGETKEITSGALDQPILLTSSNDYSRYIYMDNSYTGSGSKLVIYNAITDSASYLTTTAKAYYPMFGNNNTTVIFMSPTGTPGVTRLPGDNTAQYQQYDLMSINTNGTGEKQLNSLAANGFSRIHFYSGSQKAYFTTQTIGDNYTDTIGFYDMNPDGTSLNSYYSSANINSALLN